MNNEICKIVDCEVCTCQIVVRKENNEATVCQNSPHFLHLSSAGQSCCLLGCAETNSGLLLRLSSSLEMIGNCVRSTLNLRALNT